MGCAGQAVPRLWRASPPPRGNCIEEVFHNSEIHFLNVGPGGTSLRSGYCCLRFPARKRAMKLLGLGRAAGARGSRDLNPGSLSPRRPSKGIQSVRRWTHRQSLR